MQIKQEFCAIKDDTNIMQYVEQPCGTCKQFEISNQKCFKTIEGCSCTKQEIIPQQPQQTTIQELPKAGGNGLDEVLNIVVNYPFIAIALIIIGVLTGIFIKIQVIEFLKVNRKIIKKMGGEQK